MFKNVITAIMMHIARNRIAMLPDTARDITGAAHCANIPQIIVLMLHDSMDANSNDDSTYYRWARGEYPVSRDICYYYIMHPSALQYNIQHYILPLMPRPEAIVHHLLTQINDDSSLRDDDRMYLLADGVYDANDDIAALIVRMILWDFAQR